MGKHTPGPWVQDGKTGSIWQGPAPVNRKTGLRVAVVDLSEDRISEDRANAQLVAAAPDMAEALRACLYYLRGLDRERAVAALKKAGVLK